LRSKCLTKTDLKIKNRTDAFSRAEKDGFESDRPERMLWKLKKV
jgi:hypothetical protein